MATTCEINGKTPDIEYPVSWKYKLIAPKECDMKAIAKGVLKGKEHTLKSSNSSKNGKYNSYDLQTLVTSEDERKTLFECFKAHKLIKFVL